MSNVTNPCVPPRDSNWAGRLRSATAAARRLLLLLTLRSGNVEMWKCVASRVHPGRPGHGTGPVALSPAWGRGHAALISDKQLLGKRGARHSWSGHFSGCAFPPGLGTCGSIPLRSPLEVFLRNSFGLGKAKQSHSGWGVGNLSLLLPCSTITCISTSISSTMGSLEYLSQFLPGCVGCVTPSSLFFNRC